MALANVMNGSTTPPASLIVFGMMDGKPRAGTFAHKNEKLVRKAAKQLDLQVLKVSPELSELVAKVPPGRLYANRRTFVPAAKRELHQKLIQAAKRGPQAPAGKGQESGRFPLPPDGGPYPKDWGSIKPGHLVLATMALADGWWEAIVVERKGDILTVRWRDYPKELDFTCHYTSVALLMRPETASPSK